MVKDDGVEPRNITSVKVRVGQIPMRLCQPDEARRRPRTVMDAKFSIPFIVGLAMARRGLSLRDFSAGRSATLQSWRRPTRSLTSSTNPSTSLTR